MVVKKCCNPRNKNTFADQGTLETNFDAFGCKVTDPFVVVVHGWKEGCSNTQWVRDTLNNFVLKRKGCILCINYATIANIDYSKAVEQVDAVARTLEKKVRQLFTFGLTPENGMLYAFSLGAHVAFQAGRNLGTQKLARIDGESPCRTEQVFRLRNSSFFFCSLRSGVVGI